MPTQRRSRPDLKQQGGQQRHGEEHAEQGEQPRRAAPAKNVRPTPTPMKPTEVTRKKPLGKNSSPAAQTKAHSDEDEPQGA